MRLCSPSTASPPARGIMEGGGPQGVRRLQFIDSGGKQVIDQKNAPDAPKVARGLEGIVAAETHIAEVNGEQGRLTLRGYDVSELSGRVDFEEVAYLLWYGKLPTRAEYDR